MSRIDIALFLMQFHSATSSSIDDWWTVINFDKTMQIFVTQNQIENNWVVAVNSCASPTDDRLRYALCYAVDGTFVTRPPIGKRSIVMSVSVCVCVCPRSYLRYYTSDLHQNFCACYLWPWLDKLCTTGYMDDVIFAHKPRLLGAAAHLKRNAHAALGLAIKCAQ